MSKFLKFFLVVIVVVFFTSSAYARPSFNPKGWFKGKKKGWHGESTPPGLSKKELKAQEKAKETAEEVKSTL